MYPTYPADLNRFRNLGPSDAEPKTKTGLDAGHAEIGVGALAVTRGEVPQEANTDVMRATTTNGK
ncbi:MAG: hypothetical protein M0Z45_08830 [Actinomycetota bacterium]|nr:hypothetical protein [Actinomycetota bacterium]